MRKLLILTLILCVTFIAGCGGSSPAAPGAGSSPAAATTIPQLGFWTNNSDHMAIYQMEIKPSGDEFLIRTYHKNFPGIKTVDYIAKKSGSNLAVAVAGTSAPIVHDPAADTLGFDGGKYRRQTPDDAKKLEALKKEK